MQTYIVRYDTSNIAFIWIVVVYIVCFDATVMCLCATRCTGYMCLCEFIVNGMMHIRCFDAIFIWPARWHGFLFLQHLLAARSIIHGQHKLCVLAISKRASFLQYMLAARSIIHGEHTLCVLAISKRASNDCVCVQVLPEYRFQFKHNVMPSWYIVQT